MTDKYDPALVAALQGTPTIKALTRRLGHFNGAWWDRFASELDDALAAQGLRVVPADAVTVAREDIHHAVCNEDYRKLTPDAQHTPCYWPQGECSHVWELLTGPDR
jgi:hypothetical protein